MIPAIAFLSICCSTVYGQDNAKQDPIDKALQACLDSSQNATTVGMEDCEVRARDAWDKELNKYYKLLMGVLSADEKEKLKTSQISWLTFRDNEKAFSVAMYNNMQGTMWIPASISAQVEIIKQRTLLLKAYYADKQQQ